MDVKRILRGPWLWIILGVIAVLAVLQFISSSNGYRDIDTAEMVDHINAGEVAEVTFVAGDQEIQATLNDDLASEKVSAQWLDTQGIRLLDIVEEQAANGGAITSYDVEVPQPSFLGSLLGAVLPFLLIILFFLFLMNNVQGGGGRVMQFAKSKAKLITKDTPKTTVADVAGAQEAIE